MGKPLRIGSTVLLVAVIVLLLAEVTTSSPRLCGSCHEMAEPYETWSASAHVTVGCVGCHETPRPWYARPLSLAERAQLLARDTVRHLRGRYGEPPHPRAVGRWSPMPDEVCLQCHTADRQATSGFRILIDHVEHSERTGSCVACHVFTAHPDPDLGRPLSLMAKCYDCHGTSEQPEASAECGTCHPSGFDLRPPTHLEDPWMRDHGFASAAEGAPCSLCHEQRYCDGCHGVEIPHPAGWAESGPRGHAPLATTEPGICAPCHTEQPDPCNACHHEAYGELSGPWLEQHSGAVREQGTADCLECHEPAWCARCHRAPGEVGE